MDNQRMSSIYCLDIPNDIDRVVAHLYEHLFIESFYRYLSNLGYLAPLIANIHGETFRHIIYLHNESNNQAASAELANFVNHGGLDFCLIEQCLKRISVEDKISYKIVDREALVNNLAKLHQAGFKQLESLKNMSYQPLSNNIKTLNKSIQASIDTGQFKIVTINYVLDKCSLADMAVFANMAPALVSLTSHDLSILGASYDSDVIEDEPSSDNDLPILIVGVDYTAPSDCSTDQVHDAIDKLLDIDMSKHRKDIEQYQNQPYSPSGIIYDYHTIGLKTSWAQLKMALTVDNFIKVWQRIKIYSIDEFECDNNGASNLSPQSR